jgi:membrane protein
MSTSSPARPDAEHPRKPDAPNDLTKQSWMFVARKAFREFIDDECTDLAAALTYYAVLAVFPAMLALVSLLALVGQAEQSVATVLDVMRPLVASSTIATIEPVLTQLATAETAGLTLIIGLAGALWSASGYVGAFGRAMNRIYEIKEGRPFWKLRPIMIVITLAAVLLVAVALLILVLSGPVAQAIGGVIGLGDVALTIWSIAKWPVLALVMVMVVAVLYYATPNIQQPKFRWISVGAGVALVAWAIASFGFALYVANFGNYNATYGSLGGVIVTLLWLWITNLALLFGAEIDSEMERGRELQAGIAAEEAIQLPPRDTRNIEKSEKKEEEDIRRGRELRLAAEQRNDDAPGEDKA